MEQIYVTRRCVEGKGYAKEKKNRSQAVLQKQWNFKKAKAKN